MGDGTTLDGFHQAQQGYIELLKETLNNNHMPSVHYMGKTHSFIVNLSNEGKFGKTFSYDIARQRWDFLEAPSPKSSDMGKDSTVLINDGE